PRLSRALSTLLVLLTAACGGGEGGGGGAAVEGPPANGGTAVLGVLTDFSGLNPVTNTSILTYDVMKQALFTPLVMHDAKLEPQPYLAKSWELTDTSVVFHLRDDVMWHDGEPVTAEDVKFTFDLAKNPTTASLLGSAYLAQVKSATVIDPHTIRFSFEAPHSQALEDFWWAPLPKHLLKDVSPENLAQAPFNQHPVGSGPFRFVSWTHNQELVLAADTAFPEGLGGRPRLDRVVFRIIPEPTTMLTELVSGGIDFAGYTLLPDQAVQLKNQSGIDVRHATSREFTYLGWNNDRPQFEDPQVRRALAMAINRPEIIHALLHDYATEAVGMIPPWSPMYSEVEPLPYDPAAAKQLLTQSGWTDTNGDGIVEHGGQPLRFTILVNSANQLHKDIGTVIQQELRKLGADVQISTVEFQTLLKQHKARNYDAVISNWTLDNFKVDPTPLFSCEQAHTPGSANRAGFCDPVIDSLITRGVRTTAPAAAKQIWARFTKELQQRQPVTFLFWADDLAALGPRLQNVTTDARGKLVNLPEWWIPEGMQRQQ
ncbi:MAG TPA: ABC transporter substrate-binding protein, partial [Longimicrobiaceae bacterium]|nr:ABC transporter substrate-binding protein [Longimicrobiaceae bacterium]